MRDQGYNQFVPDEIIAQVGDIVGAANVLDDPKSDRESDEVPFRV